MRARSVVAAALAAVVALLGTACSSEREPVRVGVLLECSGFLVGSRESVLAAASLPLLERGGHRTGERVTGSAGGRRVELVPACTEFTYVHQLVFATRRLVEVDGVDVVVGPIGGAESVMFRDLASRFPDVTFIASDTGAQETMLREPPRNLFRFAPTGAQTTAGLGSYAYRDLGWRRAVVVAEDWYPGWESTAGFVAEFCALGGDVVERDWTSLRDPKPSKAARRHAEEADGVLVIGTSWTQVPYLTAYLRVARPARERLLLSGAAFFDRRNLALKGIDLSGVVVGSFVPLSSGTQAMREYRASFARSFPHLPPGAGVGIIEVPVYTALEALLTSLEETGGELDRTTSGCGRHSPASCSMPLRGRSGSTGTARPRRRTTWSASSRVSPAPCHGRERSAGSTAWSRPTTASSARRPLRRPSATRPASAGPFRPGRRSHPTTVHVNRVAAESGASPPGLSPRRTRSVGWWGDVASAVRA